MRLLIALGVGGFAVYALAAHQPIPPQFPVILILALAVGCIFR